MKLLLDTHIILWWLSDDPQLKEKTRTVIQTSTNTIFVSAVSAWEISIKKALGKLEAPDNFSETIVTEGFQLLAITPTHAEIAGALPRHHEDPFDRMLIAQAKAEDLTLVTYDKHFNKYEVPKIIS